VVGEETPIRLPPLVLLIDDDSDTRELCAGGLRDEGVVVAEAGDGDDGFQRAIETLPDLIITDISMPHVDGGEPLRGLVEFEPEAYFGKPCDYHGRLTLSGATG
jgi:CheY-like chemotaxis protein